MIPFGRGCRDGFGFPSGGRSSRIGNAFERASDGGGCRTIVRTLSGDVGIPPLFRPEARGRLDGALPWRSDRKIRDPFGRPSGRRVPRGAFRGAASSFLGCRTPRKRRMSSVENRLTPFPFRYRGTGKGASRIRGSLSGNRGLSRQSRSSTGFVNGSIRRLGFEKKEESLESPHVTKNSDSGCRSRVRVQRRLFMIPAFGSPLGGRNVAHPGLGRRRGRSRPFARGISFEP